MTAPLQGIANILAALLPVILTSGTSCQLGRRLMLALQSGDMASDDPLSSFCLEAVMQVSGEAPFPLLDLRVDLDERAVEKLMEVYERSQDLWAQE